MSVLHFKEKRFEDINAYFDYVTKCRNYPPLHRYFEEDKIRSGRLQLHVDVLEFNKSAPTIVFVPGTAIYSLCYAEFLYKLGYLGYNIVGLDPRGHGRSEGRRGDYTIKELMSDTQAAITYAIDRFNDKITVAGSSQGGIVAFYLAAVETRIQSVICQNFADLSHQKTLSLARYPRIVRLLKPLIASFGGVIEDVQIPLSIHLNLESIPIAFFGNAQKFIEQDPLALDSLSFRALRSLTNTRLPVPIEQIKVPVMVLHGTADAIFPVSYSEMLFKKLTCKKRLELYPGLNHGMLTENADKVLPPIEQWLQEIYE